MFPFFHGNLGSSPKNTPTPGGGVRFSCHDAKAKAVTQSSWWSSALGDASTHFTAFFVETKDRLFSLYLKFSKTKSLYTRFLTLTLEVFVEFRLNLNALRILHTRDLLYQQNVLTKCININLTGRFVHTRKTCLFSLEVP